MPLKSTTEKRKGDQRKEMKMSGRQALVTSENKGKNERMPLLQRGC